jgi:hypothetical protein
VRRPTTPVAATFGLREGKWLSGRVFAADARSRRSAFVVTAVTRAVWVRSSAPGLLTVDVFPANYRLVLAGPIQYPDRSTSRLSVSVQAAEEIALDVLIVSNLQGQPTAFTLSSSLAPH